MAKNIALLGDTSSHGGEIVTTNQDDNALSVGGVDVAVYGAMHYCPIVGHGTNPIILPATTRSYHNGKLIITQGAVVAAPCGAIITPIDRGVTVE